MAEVKIETTTVVKEAQLKDVVDDMDAAEANAFAMLSQSYRMNTMPEAPTSDVIPKLPECPECGRPPAKDIWFPPKDGEAQVGFMCYDNHVWSRKFPETTARAHLSWIEQKNKDLEAIYEAMKQESERDFWTYSKGPQSIGEKRDGVALPLPTAKRSCDDDEKLPDA